MSEKVLDNGKVIKTDEKNPKEIANSIVKDYKENPKVNTSESNKITSKEISEQKLKELNNNKLYNQVNTNLEKNEDNKLDKLNKIEKASSEEIANKLFEDRTKKVPKTVDLI